ncbi:hypothetical protein [Micromonospora sp. DPT]|uniref:hypothetical protein n=1 Tax=Micromonospora sp. DPT TaxID=3142975 RepID=UPI00320A902C
MAGGQHDGEGFLALLAAHVQLRGQPTAGAAQRVVGRLDADAAGWFGLQIPLFLAPAACWWARALVESTDTFQVTLPAALARACNAVVDVVIAGIGWNPARLAATNLRGVRAPTAWQ